MSGHRIDRTTEDVKREITAILREMKDPRVSSGLISVVRVEVTNDLSYCKIYVSSMQGIENAKEAVKALKAAEGFVRHELGSRLSLRHVPKPIFTATDSIEYSANISKLLLDLDKK
ncbi:ribosome-binding factor A [Clostridia bacterium]|nr:ribosome-binding factor A [Clostridia bacterium]